MDNNKLIAFENIFDGIPSDRKVIVSRYGLAVLLAEHFRRMLKRISDAKVSAVFFGAFLQSKGVILVKSDESDRTLISNSDLEVFKAHPSREGKPDAVEVLKFARSLCHLAEMAYDECACKSRRNTLQPENISFSSRKIIEKYEKEGYSLSEVSCIRPIASVIEPAAAEVAPRYESTTIALMTFGQRVS